MSERIYLHLGDKEILSVVIRNGLFSGSWNRMRMDILEGNLILPEITAKTVDTLRAFEREHRLNLNRVIFSGKNFPRQLHYETSHRKFHSTVQRVCYDICRGIFTYPCVASENRLSLDYPNDSICRTFLARPMYSQPSNFKLPFYQGVNRMKPNTLPFTDSSGNSHDRLLEQLNKIRECNPCDNQPNCMDHKYVLDATDIVIKEFKVENSYIGKLMARSLCWMTAEESRLMRLIEKEGLMIEPQPIYPAQEEDSIQEEFFSSSETEGYFSGEPDTPHLPAEPHPLLEVIHDLRESIRDTIRLLTQMKTSGGNK